MNESNPLREIIQEELHQLLHQRPWLACLCSVPRPVLIDKMDRLQCECRGWVDYCDLVDRGFDPVELMHIGRVRSGEWRLVRNKHRRRKLRRRGDHPRWSEHVGWYWIPEKH